MKLNLGCGEKKDGFVNIDWNPYANPDILHDLNKFPYPFESNSIELVEAFHVLEHLDKPLDVMRELHRILKPGGVAHIKVPHYSRGFAHPEHCHGFDITFPLFFNKNSPGSFYLGFDFELKSIKFQWDPFMHLLPKLGYPRFIVYPMKTLNAILSFLANICKPFAARVWCYWVGGFSEMDFIFVKSTLK
jgi:SAM-dependent methyltransferase